MHEVILEAVQVALGISLYMFVWQTLSIIVAVITDRVEKRRAE